MQKSDSSVLQILRLMSLEDVRQMTAFHQVQKAVNLPMAAGAEGFSQWDAPRQDKAAKAPSPVEEKLESKGNVLPFPKREMPASPPPVESQEGASEIELFLHQEMFRRREDHAHQKDGVKLYKLTNEAHIYRSSKDKGGKLKFAHTNGVLINKKQD